MLIHIEIQFNLVGFVFAEFSSGERMFTNTGV